MLRFTAAALVGAVVSSGGFRLTQRVEQCVGISAANPKANSETLSTNFDKTSYAKYLEGLNIEQLYADIKKVMTTSQACWPADGPQDGDDASYAGLFERLAWHCSGSFRSSINIDGTRSFAGGCEGGRIRHWPEREWRDNGNLDMARALLAEIKNMPEYADLSWGDLFTFAGTVAIKASGGPVSKFCFGRVDEPNGVNSLALGSEGTTTCELGNLCVTDTCQNTWLWPDQEEDDHPRCKLDQGYGRQQASHDVGLIYVYPEGPQMKKGSKFVKPERGDGHRRSQELSAKEVRELFNERMGWTDNYTVALLGGGHTLGRTHGNCAARPDKNTPCIGEFTSTSGFEGAWTTTPSQWNYEYFEAMLEDPDAWVATQSPDGADQWNILDTGNRFHKTMRLTADMSLVRDSEYLKWSKKFNDDKQFFDETFATAWYMLVHRSANHPEADDLEKDFGVCTTLDFATTDAPSTGKGGKGR